MVNFLASNEFNMLDNQVDFALVQQFLEDIRISFNSNLFRKRYDNGSTHLFPKYVHWDLDIVT